MHDLIIIGGGLAGLAAAITAKKQRLSTLLIAPEIGGELLESPYVDLPAMGKAYGPEVARRLVEQISGVDVVRARVESVTKGLTLFVIEDNRQQRYRSKAIIIATGRKTKMLGILGEDDFLGNGITTKPLSDSQFLFGKTTTVFGNDEKAAKVAIWLCENCPKVYLHAEGPFSPEVSMQLKSNIKLERLSGKIKYFSGSNSLEKIHLETSEINSLGAVILSKGEPDLEFLRQMMPARSDGLIQVDSVMKTSIKGIFAAGEVALTYNPRLPTFIYAEGILAALSAHDFVKEK